MSSDSLEATIDRLAALPRPPIDEVRDGVRRLWDALESGATRAAEPHDGGWRVHAWVKRGILLAFRWGAPATWDLPPFSFRDKDTLPTQVPWASGRDVRVVPGGTTIRGGAHLGDGVVVMPPAFVNVGAHVGAGAMIDSHALVGSCAQIGARVHLSAAAQIGGVLEPVGAMPVVVEDDAFVGGGAGLYEGTRVGRGALIAPGVVLTRAVALHDLVEERVITPGADGVLVVPERAVVVPGTRPARGTFARERGLALYSPMIVKYRDERTDASTALEEALR